MPAYSTLKPLIGAHDQFGNCTDEEASICLADEDPWG